MNQYTAQISSSTHVSIYLPRFQVLPMSQYIGSNLSSTYESTYESRYQNRFQVLPMSSGIFLTMNQLELPRFQVLPRSQCVSPAHKISIKISRYNVTHESSVCPNFKFYPGVNLSAKISSSNESVCLSRFQLIPMSQCLCPDSTHESRCLFKFQGLAMSQCVCQNFWCTTLCQKPLRQNDTSKILLLKIIIIKQTFIDIRSL